jgi:hypothetical protein
MPFLLVSTNLPGAAVADLVVVLAGTVVDATCANDIPAKNTRMLKVKKILDAVFIVYLFLMND